MWPDVFKMQQMLSHIFHEAEHQGEAAVWCGQKTRLKISGCLQNFYLFFCILKESACNAGDLGSIPESGRFPGEGNNNPLQYSCLENPMDGGAWQATYYGVAKSQTQLSDFTLITICLNEWILLSFLSFLVSFSSLPDLLTSSGSPFPL